MWAVAIQKALEAKGVRLGRPATEESLLFLERELKFAIHRTLREIYLQFDGFLSCDVDSQITLWPIERIINEKELVQDMYGMRYFAIGDILIDSDFFMSPLSHEGPVLLLHEKRQVAPSVAEFLEKLSHRDFNFLNQHP